MVVFKSTKWNFGVLGETEAAHDLNTKKTF